MMRIKTILEILLLIGVAVSSSGCVVAMVGAGAAGTVAYLSGDLESDEPYDLDTVYAAAQQALDQLGLKTIEGKATKDALSGVLVARDAEDKRIEIRLKSLATDMTEISIRIGTFGDETKSRLIYNKIRENLATP